MAIALQNAEVQSKIRWQFNNSLDLSTPSESFQYSPRKAFTDGTGANKAQVAASDQRTLTTGTDETLDLKALGCAFGTAAFTKVKAIRIELVTATTGYTLKVKAGASNGLSAWFSDASDELIVQAGGAVQLEAPIDGYVVDATHKTIQITNPAGGSATYNIIVIGEGTVS